MADGYSRATGKMSMMIAQNGPGITNFVTPVKTAYWNHTPLLLVTPQAANKTIGQGGFQEVEQMDMFRDCVCYQEEVRDPTRIAEVLNRVIEKAIRGSAPAQINIPRDMWTKVIEEALTKAVEGQMQRNVTTLIEVVLNQELGEPFRRDAMTAPNRVAGINSEDMQRSGQA